MKTNLILLLVPIIFFWVKPTELNAQQNTRPDTTYYLYLQKSGSKVSEIVKTGNKVKLKTASNKPFRSYRVVSISKTTIELNPELQITTDEIYAIKKPKRKNIIVGALFLGTGAGLFVYEVTDANLEPSFGIVAGEVLMGLGIAIMTPSVFKKKKRSLIQIVERPRE